MSDPRPDIFKWGLSAHNNPSVIIWISLWYDNVKCIAMNLNDYLKPIIISCNDRRAYVCQAPTTGVCSKEIQSKFCDNTIAGHCHHTQTGFECCKRGFEMMENGTCVDRNSILCPPKDENCVYKNGSSVCFCPDNMQGNGINACGHIITLWQIVRYPDLKLPATECAVRDKANRLRDLFSKHLLTKINMLIITKITEFDTKLFNLTYDIYCSDPNMTPGDFTNDFIKVRRTMRSSTGNKKLFSGWRKPIQASLECAPKEIGYGKRLYHFKAADAGSLAFSGENSSLGSSEATLPCKIRKYSDGSESAYLDYTAFRFPRNMIDTTSGPISIETTAGDVTNGSTLMYRFKKYYNERILDSINTTNDVRRTEVRKVGFEELIYMANELLSENQKYDTSENIDVALSVETLTTTIKLQPNNTFRLNTSSIYVEVQQFTSYHYTDVQMKDTEYEVEGIKAFLPGSAVDKALHMAEEKRTSVSFVVFRNASFFQTSDDIAIDQVLSCSIADKKITNLLEPFWYQMPVSYEKANETRRVKFIKCAYYDVEMKDWNSEGCSYVTGSNPPNCTCNHLTNFAVLVKTANLTDPYTLEIFGKVGCSLSVIGLALMLLCICYFSSLRKNLTNQIHSVLGFSLLVAYVLFLTGVEQINNRNGCITIAAFLHFFLLSAWGWMIVECATMYKKLVSVFGSTGPYYIVKAAVMVYSGSALIAVVTVAVAVGWFDRKFLKDWNPITEEDEMFAPSKYISQRLCWLHNYSLIVGFLMPIAIALVINIFGFIAISKAITCDRSKILLKSNQKKTSLQEAKTYLTRAIIFTFLLGLAWLFAIPLTMSDDDKTNIVFGWLFSVANSLQGFFVFFLFCIRRKDVRDLWTTELLKLLCIKRKDSHVKGQLKIHGTPGTSTPQTKKTDLTVTYTKTNKVKV
ncbi:uncharacterized protein LOC120338148 [Styela clava]